MFNSRRAVLQFSRQLAMLLEGGVALQVAVDLLRLQYRSRRWQALLREVGTRLRQGDPLARVLSSYPRLFPRSYVETLQWAERTGSADNLALALRLVAGDATARPVAERFVTRDSPADRARR